MAKQAFIIRFKGAERVHVGTRQGAIDQVNELLRGYYESMGLKAQMPYHTFLREVDWTLRAAPLTTE